MIVWLPGDSVTTYPLVGLQTAYLWVPEPDWQDGYRDRGRVGLGAGWAQGQGVDVLKDNSIFLTADFSLLVPDTHIHVHTLSTIYWSGGGWGVREKVSHWDNWSSERWLVIVYEHISSCGFLCLIFLVYFLKTGDKLCVFCFIFPGPSQHFHNWKINGFIWFYLVLVILLLRIQGGLSFWIKNQLSCLCIKTNSCIAQN